MIFDKIKQDIMNDSMNKAFTDKEIHHYLRLQRCTLS